MGGGGGGRLYHQEDQGHPTTIFGKYLFGSFKISEHLLLNFLLACLSLDSRTFQKW